MRRQMIQVYLEPTHVETLTTIAIQRRVPRAVLIREAIEEYLRVSSRDSRIHYEDAR